MTNSYIYADVQILLQYAHSGDPNTADDKYYYVHDRLGSVRMVVDCNTVAETVTARNTYTYSPFGNPYAGELSETVYNPFQFTGQWYDVEIDQYYLRARMYDPTMMRFTTRDPARGFREEPSSFHRYLYCFNSPVDFVDPSGRSLLGLVNAVVEGGAIHAEAVDITAYGVAMGNDRFITLGILMQQMVSPAMQIASAIQIPGMRIAGAIQSRVAQLEGARDAIDGISAKVEQLGITPEEAYTMMEWADEYNINRSETIERHLSGNYREWHIRVGSHPHITVKGYNP